MIKIISKLFKKKSLQLKDNERFKEQLKGFKAQGSLASTLKKRGYPAWALKASGYSIEEMKEGGYTARALKMAGFPKEEVDKIYEI